VVDLIIIAVVANHDKIMKLSKELSVLADDAINGGVRDLEEKMLLEEKKMNEADGHDYTEEQLKEIVAARLKNNHFSRNIDDKIQKMKEVM
jgi:hypothetical protein